MSQPRVARSDTYAALCEILDQSGFRYRAETARKHPRFRVVVDGVERIFVFPGSPSSERGHGLQNARALLRHELAQWTGEKIMGSDAVVIEGREIKPLHHGGIPVVTLRQIDELHEKADGQARKQYNNHRDRYTRGVDFYELSEPSEIRTLGISRPQGGVPERVLLFSERGYGKIVRGVER